ncbi:hypothetical protein AURDEDRAFT_168464, partial [Auricularia subglabra TFB-10046 SS5]
GQTYVWSSPRVEQDLPGFVDDAAHELNVSSWVHRQHGYANTANDMKRKLAKESRSLTSSKGRREDDEAVEEGEDVELEVEAKQAGPSKKRKRDAQDENVAPAKKSCADGDVIEID